MTDKERKFAQMLKLEFGIGAEAARKEELARRPHFKIPPYRTVGEIAKGRILHPCEERRKK